MNLPSNARRSSLLVPAWGMEQYTSAAWWPASSQVWLPLPTLSQFTVTTSALDFQSVLKMLNILESKVVASAHQGIPPPNKPVLQRRSITAHRLIDDHDDDAMSDISDDDETEAVDYDADCESSDHPRVATWPSPLRAGRCSGAPSAVDAAPCPDHVEQVVPRSFLLQFGALMGEHESIQVWVHKGCGGTGCVYEYHTQTPTQQALHNECIPWAWSTSGRGSVFGAMEGPCNPSCTTWEACGEGTSATSHFQCWRMPLRSGYCMWLSVTELHDIAADDVARFNLHNRTRFLWDDTALVHETLPIDSNSTPDSHALSCVQQYRCRYPAPMAARQYVYARRVWRRPRDGAYYIISHACAPPACGLAVNNGRVCAITDYVSCMCIEPVRGPDGRVSTRVINVYFEDPSTPPSVTNMAIRKGLWQFTQRHERALREHIVRAGMMADAYDPNATPHTEGVPDTDVYDRVLARMCADNVHRRRGGGLRRMVSTGGRLVMGVSSKALRPLALLTAPPTVRSRMATVMVVGLLRGVVAAGEQQ